MAPARKRRRTKKQASPAEHQSPLGTQGALDLEKQPKTPVLRVKVPAKKEGHDLDASGLEPLIHEDRMCSVCCVRILYPEMLTDEEQLEDPDVSTLSCPLRHGDDGRCRFQTPDGFSTSMNHADYRDCGARHSWLEFPTLAEEAHVGDSWQCLARQGAVQLCEHVHIPWVAIEAHVAHWRKGGFGDWQTCFDHFDIECNGLTPRRQTGCHGNPLPAGVMSFSQRAVYIGLLR